MERGLCGLSKINATKYTLTYKGFETINLTLHSQRKTIKLNSNNIGRIIN